LGTAGIQNVEVLLDSQHQIRNVKEKGLGKKENRGALCDRRGNYRGLECPKDLSLINHYGQLTGGQKIAYKRRGGGRDDL